MKYACDAHAQAQACTRFLSFVIFCLSKQSNRVRGRCVCMRFGEYFKRMIKRTISRYNYVYLYV